MQTQESRTRRFATGWMMLPAVGLTLAYGGAVSCWFLYLKSTLRFPSMWSVGPWRMIPTEHYVPFTLVNVVLLALLLISLWGTRRSVAGLRRGQTVGAVLSILLVLIAQVGAQALHRSMPGPIADSERIDLALAGRGPSVSQATRHLRARLADLVFEYEERWHTDSEELWFRGKASADLPGVGPEWIQGTLVVREEGQGLRLFMSLTGVTIESWSGGQDPRENAWLDLSPGARWKVGWGLAPFLSLEPDRFEKWQEIVDRQLKDWLAP